MTRRSNISEVSNCDIVSVGVLQNDDVTWTPELPDWKRVGLFGFHMATYLKLFLAWDKPFWDLKTEYVVYADPDTRGYYKYDAVVLCNGIPGTTSTNSVIY